jgi:hypothetical protein
MHTANMKRQVRPELLDSLEPEDPAAIHNRRDLRILNRIMGNYRWMRFALEEILLPGDSVLELGAGTGELGGYLRKQASFSSFNYAGLDLWPRPTDWPTDWAWHHLDLNAYANYADHSVLCGNLILHQFKDSAIRTLFQSILPNVRALVFCETARRALHLMQLPLANLLRINYVSRHDARVSVEGGFKGQELPELLGIKRPDWKYSVKMTFWGAYRLIAVRNVVNRPETSTAGHSG